MSDGGLSITSTCGECGERIYTGPRDLVIGGQLIAEKCVVDLDENHAAFVAHWQAEHPDKEMPPRVI